MREIKFRAWDKEIREMYYMDDNTTRNNSIMDMAMVFDQLNPYALVEIYGQNKRKVVTDIELMQYTGLKDKNGMEIYEGDVLDASFINPFTGNKAIKKYEVVFRRGYFKAKHINGSPFEDTLLYFSNKESEVIGNIYENPELLEGAR